MKGHAMRVLYSVGGEFLIGWLPGCGACFNLYYGQKERVGMKIRNEWKIEI